VTSWSERRAASKADRAAREAEANKSPEERSRDALSRRYFEIVLPAGEAARWIEPIELVGWRLIASNGYAAAVPTSGDISGDAKLGYQQVTFDTEVHHFTRLLFQRS
jgi:hypothetical protein